jgi:hypothetical protein
MDNNGMVYFIDPNDILSHHIRRKKAQIDAEMAEIREELGQIRAAKDGLERVEELLRQMRELAVRAAEGDVTQPKRVALNGEFQALKVKIAEAVAGAEYNGVNLLEGSISDIAAVIAAIGDDLS